MYVFLCVYVSVSVCLCVYEVEGIKRERKERWKERESYALGGYFLM